MGGREAATCVVVFCIFPTIPVESTLLASVLLSQLDDQRKLGDEGTHIFDNESDTAHADISTDRGTGSPVGFQHHVRSLDPHPHRTPSNARDNCAVLCLFVSFQQFLLSQHYWQVCSCLSWMIIKHKPCQTPQRMQAQITQSVKEKGRGEGRRQEHTFIMRSNSGYSMRPLASVSMERIIFSISSRGWSPKPRPFIARAISSASMAPEPSASKRLKASLICSSVRAAILELCELFLLSCSKVYGTQHLNSVHGIYKPLLRDMS